MDHSFLSITRRFQCGFTIVEMLVALSIFMLVVVSGLGAVTAVTDASRRAEAQRTAYANLSEAVDAIVRRARIGYNYSCGSNSRPDAARNCPDGREPFAFEDFEGDPTNRYDQIVYRRQIDPITGNRVLSVSTDSGATYLPLTSSDIDITWLEFFTYDVGRGITGLRQPYTTIIIRGTVTIGQQTETVHIQTTVSQRVLNN